MNKQKTVDSKVLAILRECPETRYDDAEKMKAEKEAVYQMAGDTAKAIVSDPEKFKAFLDTQSRLDRYSAVNALLIFKQLPEASQLKNFDDWSKDNVKIQKGAKSISILEPVEYAKKDGTTGISYNVKKVFDVSQTNGKRPPAPTVNRDPKALITVMLDSSPVEVEATNELPYPNMAAFYNNEEQTLYVKRDVGDSVAVAQCVAQELGHAQLSINSDSYSRADMGFQAVCIGYMLCKKYGVDKELQRVNRDVMEVLDNKDIIRVFPRTLSNTNTSLVLKTPKTKTSVRKIFLPSTVAQMLLERKKQIDEMKELFGDEYLDYDLVFCHSSGRPMEGQVINRALKKLIQDNDLPDVVFHSFRHASITYKLKWNGGDMKSVQGDSGHARMDMVADVYSHIIDEDRRYNAQKFEEQFYNAKGLKNAEEGKTAPMPKFETSVELLDPMAEVQKESEVEKEKPAENSTDENAALLTKLLSNPETAALLKALAKTI